VSGHARADSAAFRCCSPLLTGSCPRLTLTHRTETDFVKVRIQVKQPVVIHAVTAVVTIAGFWNARRSDNKPEVSMLPSNLP
jgi:hypothetical protein